MLSKLDMAAHNWNPRTQPSREESCSVETSFCCSVDSVSKIKGREEGASSLASPFSMAPGLRN